MAQARFQVESSGRDKVSVRYTILFPIHTGFLVLCAQFPEVKLFDCDFQIPGLGVIFHVSSLPVFARLICEYPMNAVQGLEQAGLFVQFGGKGRAV